jgi:hypothetical protein
LSNYRNEHRNTNDLRAVSIGSSKGLQVILRTKSIVCSDLSYNLQLTSDGLVSHSFLISRTYHCVGFGSRREWVTALVWRQRCLPRCYLRYRTSTFQNAEW